MEAEAVFQVVASGFDEYPGDGYRLKLVMGATPLPPGYDRIPPPDTTILTMLGFNTRELKVGDEIRVHAKVVSRLVTERKIVP